MTSNSTTSSADIRKMSRQRRSSRASQKSLPCSRRNAAPVCWCGRARRAPHIGAMKQPRNISGRQVRTLRLVQGLSQSSLAARCQRQGWDISRETLAKIEAGIRWVGDFELVRLAKALSVPEQKLFDQDH